MWCVVCDAWAVCCLLVVVGGWQVVVCVGVFGWRVAVCVVAVCLVCVCVCVWFSLLRVGG